MNKKDDIGLDKKIDFMIAAFKEIENKDPDIDYSFSCPICGGLAYARKNGYNGHKRAHCENCGIRIIE